MDAVQTKSLHLWQLIIKRFHKRAILLSVFLYFCATLSFAQTRLEGKWVDADHSEKQVEMFMAGNNKFYGKSKKGLIVFRDFIYDPKLGTYSGFLINPDDGQEFPISIKQSSSNYFTFTITKFIFRKKFVFKRISVN